MKILITGAAGFIGYHLCERLLTLGHEVFGLDNINGYYDITLKYARLNQLGIDNHEAEKFGNVVQSDIHGKKMLFIRMNLQDQENLENLFKENTFDLVCNLAAQAGVRYSIENPQAYIDSNINGFMNILECCRHFNINRLIYASSSSVYGNSSKVPFLESDNVDNPISIYAATKKSNELMAHVYSHLYGIETIGLRFFTVYGPWGRPDMAMFLFVNAVLNNKPIKVFNNGNLSRDFTFIDDIINGIINIIISDEKKEAYRIYNIGNNKPVPLLKFIKHIQSISGQVAKLELLPMQPGDVLQTYAGTSKLNKDHHYQPKTSIKDGVKKYLTWHLNYYKEHGKN